MILVNFFVSYNFFFLVQEIFNKPKYFVRYPAGGCGHFFTVLLMSFVAPVQTAPLFSGHGHIEKEFVDQYHNFSSHYNTVNATRDEYANNSNNLKFIAQCQNTYKFLPSPWPYYCIHTHLIRTDLWAQAWSGARLIKIQSNLHDQDQMAYNWMLKNQHRSFYSDYIEQNLVLVQDYFRIKPTIDLTDSRAQCWIIKHGLRYHWRQFNAWQIPNEIQVEFDQVFQGTLDLAALCRDLDINCDSQGLARAQELLQNYAKVQSPVPWQLNLQDYQ